MLLGAPWQLLPAGCLTHAIVRPLLRTPWVALPNLIAQRELVPEFLQGAATPAALAAALMPLLEKERAAKLRAEFNKLREKLLGDTAARALAALAPLVSQGQLHHASH